MSNIGSDTAMGSRHLMWFIVDEKKKREVRGEWLHEDEYVRGQPGIPKDLQGRWTLDVKGC